MYQKFNWILYLDLANELLTGVFSGQQPQTDTKISEAYYRSSISRAYYAAFSVARNYSQESLGLSIPRSADSHRLVAEVFEKKNRKIANILRSLREKRNKADYEDTASPRLFNIAKQSAKESEDVIELINKLPIN